MTTSSSATVVTSGPTLVTASAASDGAHHDGARDLVVPRLLARIPDHPEVPEAEHETGQDAGDVATDRARDADDGTSGRVDDPDVCSHATDRLSLGPLEDREVGDAQDEVDQADCAVVAREPREHAAEDTDDQLVEYEGAR